MYLLAPFILQNFLKSSRVMRCAIVGEKWPICPEQNFFGANHYYCFHLPFILRIQSYEDALFLGPKWFICPKQIFFGKLLISFSCTYETLSFCKPLEKFFLWIQSCEDVQFLGPKWPFSPKEIFSENLLMSLVSFIRVYLHGRNQSRIFIYY